MTGQAAARRDAMELRAIGRGWAGPPPVETPARRAVETPTWIMLGLCYSVWALALWSHQSIGLGVMSVLCALMVALHSSLQHEALHGHPTRSATLNEALVFPSLNLVYPYRRFRDTHLRHHHDERLTDPYDDPESWYRAEGDLRRASALLRLLLRINATLAGRLLIGPWLGVIGLWRADFRQGGARMRGAYVRHAAGAGLALAYVWGVCGVHPLLYLPLAAWPGLSLLTLRTYAEHRAAERVAERTAVVEAEAPLALLFLNNNLHAVHHAHPRAPWYELPALWRARRAEVLAANGGYRYGGYAEIAWRWLFRAREPVAHPFLRREEREQDRGPIPRPMTQDRGP